MTAFLMFRDYFVGNCAILPLRSVPMIEFLMPFHTDETKFAIVLKMPLMKPHTALNTVTIVFQIADATVLIVFQIALNIAPKKFAIGIKNVFKIQLKIPMNMTAMICAIVEMIVHTTVKIAVQIETQMLNSELDDEYDCIEHWCKNRVPYRCNGVEYE
jgi:hypothetical protein